MKKLSPWLAALAVAIIVNSCTKSGQQQPAPVMKLPVTTASEEAREQFMSGMHAADMGRFIDARGHFEKAVQKDPAFAFAYWALANASNSVKEFTANLKKAEEAASGASREEQLLIEITKKGFDNDIEGQLAAAKTLVELAPESPRTWLALAGVQSSLNQHTEARQSIARAIEVAPNMAAAYMQAGNSYLFGEPKDLIQAEQQIRKAIELAPKEPSPYDLLGDVHRAQGQLEKARDAYTEAGKYSGADGSPFQQRGHVNSFLGDYDAARADYDKSIAMARDNEAPSYGVYKAFVHVYAGDPSAAIAELKAIASNIDKMNIPEPIGFKTFALSSATNIALYHKMIDEAETLIADWRALMRAQAEQVGTDVFRRGQEAGIAYVEGMLAVKKGKFDDAEEKANAIAKLVEPDANPRKMEPVHELRGAIALEQGHYAEAAEHFRQGNHENDIYIKYLLAKSLEGAGQTDEAMKLYQQVANYNFNDVYFALTRKEAMMKVGS
jgi:tetratricopeptide (TPR) repeat protein